MGDRLGERGTNGGLDERIGKRGTPKVAGGSSLFRTSETMTAHGGSSCGDCEASGESASSTADAAAARRGASDCGG